MEVINGKKDNVLPIVILVAQQSIFTAMKRSLLTSLSQQTTESSLGILITASSFVSVVAMVQEVFPMVPGFNEHSVENLAPIELSSACVKVLSQAGYIER